MIASTQTNHPLSGFSVATKENSPLEVACERLRAAGLRITQPRVAIINVLLSRSRPASIEQIHGQLDQTTCDLVTVYRCLNAFQKAGLVRLSYFHNGTSLYQIVLNDTEANFHVVDRASQESEALDPGLADELKQIIRRIESDLKTKGYSGISHVVNFVADRGSPILAPERSEAPDLANL